MELLPQLLKMMDVKTMTGSEGQRKLTLGNATILAYCLRWAGFRVRPPFMNAQKHALLHSSNASFTRWLQYIL